MVSLYCLATIEALARVVDTARDALTWLSSCIK